MKRKKSLDVVKGFFDHEEGSTSIASLRSYNDKLFTYHTCIGEWHEGQLYINIAQYSVTSSKHQGFLLSMVHDFHSVKVVDPAQAYQGIQTLHDCKCLPFEIALKKTITKFRWYRKFVS